MELDKILIFGKSFLVTASSMGLANLIFAKYSDILGGKANEQLKRIQGFNRGQLGTLFMSFAGIGALALARKVGEMPFENLSNNPEEIMATSGTVLTTMAMSSLVGLFATERKSRNIKNEIESIRSEIFYSHSGDDCILTTKIPSEIVKHLEPLMRDQNLAMVAYPIPTTVNYGDVIVEVEQEEYMGVDVFISNRYEGEENRQYFAESIWKAHKDSLKEERENNKVKV